MRDIDLYGKGGYMGSEKIGGVLLGGGNWRKSRPGFGGKDE